MADDERSSSSSRCTRAGCSSHTFREQGAVVLKADRNVQLRGVLVLFSPRDLRTAAEGACEDVCVRRRPA